MKTPNTPALTPALSHREREKIGTGGGKRFGDWFVTYSGKRFYPLDPRAEDVCIGDIAHNLANLCRFNGATRQFYSVAQHCVLVAEHCSKENFLAGLLHEATEAYCGDMIRPIKSVMLDFKEMEGLIWRRAIAPAFGLTSYLPQEIKVIDLQALATERRDLMVRCPKDWIKEEERVEPFPVKIVAWAPAEAEERFLEVFNRTGKL